eukprot:2994918-Rhodomonas_salina.2
MRSVSAGNRKPRAELDGRVDLTGTPRADGGRKSAAHLCRTSDRAGGRKEEGDRGGKKGRWRHVDGGPGERRAGREVERKKSEAVVFRLSGC